MSQPDPAGRSRHRQHWSQSSPAMLASVLAVIWLVVTAGLWVGLGPGADPDPIGAPPPAPPPASPPDASSGASSAPTAGPAAVDSPAPQRPAATELVSTSAAATSPPGPGAHPGPAGERPAPPTGPLLTIRQDAVPPVVDLSAEGVLDWVHWGLRSPGSMNRKAGGANAITDEGTSGPRERYDTNTRQFTWHGGTPEQAVSNTPTGVFACGVDSGFTIAVAAGPGTRVLRFYAGVARATGRLEASLSGTGLTRTATMSTTSPFAHTARFSITFRAPAGGRLRLRWVATEVFNMYCGHVNMQAATLS